MVNTVSLVKEADNCFNGEERNNQIPYWQDLTRYIWQTQYGNFYGENTKGGSKTNDVFDPSPSQDAWDLANAIHSTLTNPATKWSNLNYVNNIYLGKNYLVPFLDNATQAFHRHLNRSNFDNQVSKFYLSLVTLGTGVLLFTEDTDSAGRFKKYRFKALHLSEIDFLEDANGKPETVYRKYKMTNSQLMELYEDSLPDNIKREAVKFPEKEQDMYFILKPNPKGKKGPIREKLTNPEDFPYHGHYVLKKGHVLLETENYYENPFIIVRWSLRPGEKWGTGPGHLALPEIKMLNATRDLALKAQALNTLRPQKVSERDLIEDPIIEPGSLIVLEDSNSMQPLDLGNSYNESALQIQEMRELVKKIFFLDKLFLPPRTETGEMTAYEIDQRLAQTHRVIGPTLSRLNTEQLEVITLRGFNILYRAGELGDIPGELERDEDFEITFVNQLAKAQKVEELLSIRSFIQQDLATAAQFDPTVIDTVNLDEYIRKAHMTGALPPSLLRAKEEVDQIRQQRQQAAQSQQLVEQGIGVADILSKTKGLSQ